MIIIPKTKGDQLGVKIGGNKVNMQSQGKNKVTRRGTRIKQLLNQMRELLVDINVRKTQQINL